MSGFKEKTEEVVVVCKRCGYEGKGYEEGLCYQCFIDKGAPSQKEIEEKF